MTKAPSLVPRPMHVTSCRWITSPLRFRAVLHLWRNGSPCAWTAFFFRHEDIIHYKWTHGNEIADIESKPRIGLQCSIQWRSCFLSRKGWWPQWTCLLVCDKRTSSLWCTLLQIAIRKNSCRKEQDVVEGDRLLCVCLELLVPFFLVHGDWLQMSDVQGFHHPQWQIFLWNLYCTSLNGLLLVSSSHRWRASYLWNLQ